MHLCTVVGCEHSARKGKTSPFCEKHYSRVRRHGDPNVALKDHTPAAQRWKKQYVIDERTQCWNWTGPQTRGYGFIQDGAAHRYQVHRFVYEQLVGSIPDGLELDHKCRNTLCINPRHVEPVTHLVNVRRGNAGINNAVKTRCVHGHDFTPENTIVTKDGRRNCRICQRKLNREAMRRYRARKRGGADA